MTDAPLEHVLAEQRSCCAPIAARDEPFVYDERSPLGSRSAPLGV